MANSQILGIVAPVPQGDWNNETQYNQLNIVRANKAAYIAVVASKGIEPGQTTNWTSYWKKLTQDGRSVSGFSTGASSQSNGYTLTAITVSYDDNTSETIQISAKNGTSITTVTTGDITQEGNYTVTQLIITLSDGSTQNIEVKAKNGAVGSSTVYVDGEAVERVDLQKTTTVTATLLASGWTGSANAWTQTLTVQGVAAETTQYIDLPANSTASNDIAFSSAMLRDGGQSSNSITLNSVADEKPTSDINIRITIVGGIV